MNMAFLYNQPFIQGNWIYLHSPIQYLVPSISPLSRIGAFTPNCKQSVIDISAEILFLTGPKITTL